MIGARDLAPDERHPKSLAYGLIIGPGILSLIVCSLRLYTRTIVIRSFGADDVAVCIALATTHVFNGLGIAIVYYGQGQHFDSLSEHQMDTWLKLYYVAMCLYLYVSLVVKLSLLLFIRRIFVSNWLQHLTAGLVLYQVAFSVSGSFALAFQCTPVRAAYDRSIQDPDGFSQFTLYQITLYQAVLIFVGDLIILIAPLPILCRLRMPTRKIVALLVIFGSGIIACIAPLVRFSTLGYLRDGSTDLTFTSTSSLYWMVIEFNLGLVAGSLSSLRPLPFFRRFGSSANSHDHGSQPDTGQELQRLPARGRKRKPCIGDTLTIGLHDTENGSHERIIVQKTEFTVAWN
ncbi:hypothetical protein BDW74DRAFT_188641 [Aspergillus multicolor]|uniref:uncharacterized protein n=1 Tax=Aspergillus multicolor TaxID=41759 RepID=UPI003CCD2AF6